MVRQIVIGLVVGLLLATPGATVSACCDWTPQDTAFWDKMSQNPQKFSYEMGAQLTHFRIRTGGEEEVVNPASAQRDDFWRHILHHTRHKHNNHKSSAPGPVRDAASGRNAHEGAR